MLNRLPLSKRGPIFCCPAIPAGDLDAAGQRTSPACKVAYPNRDTYFGAYASGAKAGTGLYVAANGAAYVGQYAAGKRCGFGLMILPDGGLYKGGFKEDKFEGQVRLRRQVPRPPLKHLLTVCHPWAAELWVLRGQAAAQQHVTCQADSCQQQTALAQQTHTRVVFCCLCAGHLLVP